MNANVGHVTIEKTSKNLKGNLLAAYATTVVGFAVVAVGGSEANGVVAGLASMAFGGGLVWVIVTKARIWWNHG